MRWVISSLDEFRRIVSRVTTFIILITPPAMALSSFLPQQRVLVPFGLVPLILAIAVKFAIARFPVHPFPTIRLVEGAAYAILALGAAASIYRAWLDGLEELAPALIDAPILVAAAILVRRNILAARSMVSTVSP